MTGSCADKCAAKSTNSVICTSNLANNVLTFNGFNSYRVIIIGTLIASDAFIISHNAHSVKNLITVTDFGSEGTVGIDSEIIAKCSLKLAYSKRSGNGDYVLFYRNIFLFGVKDVKGVAYRVVNGIVAHSLRHIIKVDSLAARVTLLKLRIRETVEGRGNLDCIFCTVDTNVNVLCKLTLGNGNYYGDLIPLVILHIANSCACGFKRNVIDRYYNTAFKSHLLAVECKSRTAPAVRTENAVSVACHSLCVDNHTCVLFEKQRELKCIILCVILRISCNIEAVASCIGEGIYEIGRKLAAKTVDRGNSVRYRPRHFGAAVIYGFAYVKIKIALGGCMRHYIKKSFCLLIHYLLA